MNRIIQKRCKNCCSRANLKNKKGIRSLTPNPLSPNYEPNYCPQAILLSANETACKLYESPFGSYKYAFILTV